MIPDTAPRDSPPAQPPARPPVLNSAELMRGAREVVILHAGQTYRLRITSKDRLILTK